MKLIPRTPWFLILPVSALSCIPSARPFVVAHRGGDMTLPGSSLAAFSQTVEKEAADFLECDLTITKDGVLVCQHEPDLAMSTDALSFPDLFKEERRSKEQLDPVLDFNWSDDGASKQSFLRSDCRPRNSWYTTDYEWNHTISKLSAPCAAHQRCGNVKSPLATLDDLWTLVSGHADKRELAIASGEENVPREIGLYLEIKHATWHQSRRDRDMITIFLAYLMTHSRLNASLGFPLYIQSFEIVDLVRLRQHLGFEHPEIKLVALASNLRTIFNLPVDCCAEDQPSKSFLKALVQADNESSGTDESQYLRQDGSFGEMFVGVARIPRVLDGSSLDPRIECKNGRRRRHLEDRFLAPDRVKPHQSCTAKDCDGVNIGLKMVPLGLRIAESFAVDSDIRPESRAEVCRRELERFADQLYITCPTEEFSSTYVLDSAASPGELFDISCFTDVIGIHLDMVVKHPEIVQQAHDRCMPLHVWTVRTEEDLKVALDLKVDGFITDDAQRASVYLSAAQAT